MTHLGLTDALKEASGGHGQAWQYTASLARLVIRVWFEDASTSGIYFVCSGCRRIELSTHWHPVQLVVAQPDERREWWLLNDGDHCRVECTMIFAVRSDEFLQL